MFVFFISVPFKVRIGISGVEGNLPIIRTGTADMTNFRARQLGSRVTISFASGFQQTKTTYKWTLNGTILKPGINPRLFISTDISQLSIRLGSLADEGAYQLFASNEFGTLFSRKIWLKFSG